MSIEEQLRITTQALVNIRDLVPGESDDPDRDLAIIWDLAAIALNDVNYEE